MTPCFLLLLAMTFLGAVASLFLKKASCNGGLWKILADARLYIGALMYLASAILNIVILRRMDYSLVLPLTSLTYVWTMALSRLFLGERVTRRKLCGVALIMLGAVCISL